MTDHMDLEVEVDFGGGLYGTTGYGDKPTVQGSLKFPGVRARVESPYCTIHKERLWTDSQCEKCRANIEAVVEDKLGLNKHPLEQLAGSSPSPEVMAIFDRLDNLEASNAALRAELKELQDGAAAT